MLLGFVNPATAQQSVQQELVSARVERADLQPLLQILESFCGFVAGESADQLLEHA